MSFVKSKSQKLVFMTVQAVPSLFENNPPKMCDISEEAKSFFSSLEIEKTAITIAAKRIVERVWL